MNFDNLQIKILYAPIVQRLPEFLNFDDFYCFKNKQIFIPVYHLRSSYCKVENR